jgi:hypothetical protein
MSLHGFAHGSGLQVFASCFFGPGFRADLRSDTPFISCGISFYIKSILRMHVV